MAAIHKYAEDLTGQVFGYYTVVEYVGSKPGGGSIWQCICKCGTTKEVWATHLKQGRVKSCGCYSRELARQGLAPGESLTKRLLRQYKKNAGLRGINWLIDDEIAKYLFSQSCFYCGTAPSNKMQQDNQPDI